MFGYVKIAEGELKVKELKNYKALYCGLCKQIANYSQFARLMLSYDMVFLCLLFDTSDANCAGNCDRKFQNKCKKSFGSEKMKYVAAISIILQYYKLQNDYYDGEKKKRYFMYAIQRGYKKASEDFPYLNACIKDSMTKLYRLEQERCSDLMKLEKCFSNMFYRFFTDYSKDEHADISGTIAYHVASWVYWFDMYMDIGDDRKSGNYNAILLQNDIEEGKRSVWSRMLFHLEHAESMLSLLPFNDNMPIINNIITLGMPLQMEKQQLERSVNDEVS